MYKNIVTQTLCNPLHKLKKIDVDVLRLDLIHPVVSGNKWFKLKYYLLNAVEHRKKGIVSFGGAWSNHLVALSYACRENGLLSAGIIRGDGYDPENYSLNEMQKNGMRLIFASRESYRYKEKLIHDFLATEGDYHYVPEGGQSTEGIRGAGEILSHARKGYSHVICSTGTGTTLAGLVSSGDPDSVTIGISAIKVKDENDNELTRFIRQHSDNRKFSIQFNYHFGGYAKKTDELILFMNRFYESEHIPSDFIYTGKMFYAVEEMIRNDYFDPGSRLLLIHTDGLQGNRSLPAGMLVF